MIAAASSSAVADPEASLEATATGPTASCRTGGWLCGGGCGRPPSLLRWWGRGGHKKVLVHFFNDEDLSR